MTTIRLSELENGQKARIVKINLEGDIRRRLSDMGLVNDAEVQLLRVAPSVTRSRYASKVMTYPFVKKSSPR